MVGSGWIEAREVVGPMGITRKEAGRVARSRGSGKIPRNKEEWVAAAGRI